MRNIDLLLKIADELRIKRGDSELEAHWLNRILYSAIGRMTLSSLLDQRDNEDENITKVHLTSAAKRYYEAYYSIYSELSPETIQSPDFLADVIYKQYEAEGYIYHEPYRLCVAKESSAVMSGIRWIRKNGLADDIFMSGLGMYDMETTDPNGISFVEMFQLDETSLSDVVSSLLELVEWKIFEVQEGIEYLQISPNYRYGYWKTRPDNNTDVSLMRYGLGEKQYALYKSTNGILQYSNLPRWQYENRQYLLISNALLYKNGILPPIKFHRDESVVEVKLGYLLPISEQNILMLYSWPHDMKCAKETLQYLMNRDMSIEVFYGIRKAFETIGYRFEEI